MTHIFVDNLTIIGSDDNLSPGRRQAIIWINAGILWIRSVGTIFSEILSTMHTFSFKNMHLKLSSAAIRSRPQCVNDHCIKNSLAWTASTDDSRSLVWSISAVIQGVVQEHGRDTKPPFIMLIWNLLVTICNIFNVEYNYTSMSYFKLKIRHRW